MCTAITYQTDNFYFGRTLDYEFSYGEKITIVPRNYQLKFRHTKTMNNHYAIIGMAHVTDNYPLFYEAVNESGLGIAGLNFVGNASYQEPTINKNNIAQFEFIPWLLSQCQNISEVKNLLKETNITNEAFSSSYLAAQLHWLIADQNQSIVVEAVSEGLKIYDNPVGVLTNNPSFDKQLFALNNYRHLTNKNPQNTFSQNVNLDLYSRGLGALGLPGDISSQSRFIRASFVKTNSVSSNGEVASVNQFFHLLNTVEQVRGCCEVKKNEYEITIYTSCINATQGIYYYTTYNNHQINAIAMHKENLESHDLIMYPLIDTEHINHLN